MAAEYIPCVETIGCSIEREATTFAFLVLDVDFSVVGKAYFGMAVTPQSIDGNEGLCEARDAANASDEQLPLLAAVVGSQNGKIAHTLDFALGALDARHGVVRRAPVD